MERLLDYICENETTGLLGIRGVITNYSKQEVCGMILGGFKAFKMSHRD